eukprot:4634631-Pleurochrysis_carterae.AAC.2
MYRAVIRLQILTMRNSANLRQSVQSSVAVLVCPSVCRSTALAKIFSRGDEIRLQVVMSCAGRRGNRKTGKGPQRGVSCRSVRTSGARGAAAARSGAT